jgi:cyclase
MLGKRLVGVITVKDGWAVQSFGFGRYLPLGRAEILADNLDRWGADEILVLCIDRGAAGPDLALLRRMAAKGLSTPLIYGGGIRSVEHAVAVVASGADRIAVDALLRDDPGVVPGIEAALGAQAVIAALPLGIEGDALVSFDYRTRTRAPLAEATLALLRAGSISEVLAMDHVNDGGTAFDERIVERFPVPALPLIVFGGLRDPDQIRRVLGRPSVRAVAIGNSLSYGENRIRQLKSKLGALPIRAPSYHRWIDR